MVESVLLSTPLCELRPVHVYSPSWLALTPVIFNTEVTLPVVNSNSPKSGVIGEWEVTVSLWGNDAGDPCCSQDMVGTGLPLEVQEISVASPSSTVFVVFSWDVVIGGSAN